MSPGDRIIAINDYDVTLQPHDAVISLVKMQPLNRPLRVHRPVPPSYQLVSAARTSCVDPRVLPPPKKARAPVLLCATC